MHGAPGRLSGPNSIFGNSLEAGTFLISQFLHFCVYV